MSVAIDKYQKSATAQQRMQTGRRGDKKSAIETQNIITSSCNDPLPVPAARKETAIDKSF